MATLPALTAMLTYRLILSPETFRSAAERLAARVLAEGDQGVLSYRFFVDNGQTARALVDYRDTAAWMGHHRLIGGWPEIAELRQAAAVSEIVFLGDVTGEMFDWLAAAGIKATILSGNTLAAGFVR